MGGRWIKLDWRCLWFTNIFSTPTVIKFLDRSRASQAGHFCLDGKAGQTGQSVNAGLLGLANA